MEPKRKRKIQNRKRERKKCSAYVSKYRHVCNDKTNDIVYFPTLLYFESVPSFYSLVPHESVSIKRRGRQSREKGT